MTCACTNLEKSILTTLYTHFGEKTGDFPPNIRVHLSWLSSGDQHNGGHGTHHPDALPARQPFL